MGRTCPFCSSSEIDEDPSRADVVCMSCGSVLEESAIVSEVTFQERAGGHDIVGQYVSRDRQQTGLVGVPGLSRTESREVTYQKGRKLIQEVASQLRINQHCIETAFNFFKMSVSRNFTRGRPRSHVVAACLYMTCRLENTSHLLLDFSDVTQVNVYELGKTLSNLTRILKIQLPTTDPCLYVLRFAIMLEFGDKQKEVVTLATRIVQRMKRDWMATGRRPTGLCGAALLLASRAYGFSRSISDVVRIVHISDTVVRKRLDEFASTPSGGLTIDEFASVDLEHSEDPPAFQEARRRAREEKRKKEERDAEAATKELAPVQKEIENALKAKLKKSPYGKLIASSVGEDDVDELSSNIGQMVREEIIDNVYEYADDDFYDDDPGPSSSRRIDCGPTLEFLGVKPNSSIDESVVSEDEEILVDDNDFDDLDDSEIDSYILSESEAKLKSRIWMKRNGPHLVEMERKRKLRQEEEEAKAKDPNRKRRPATRKRDPINAANHSDAMAQVIKEKKLSTKINYDVLAEIENGTLEILDDAPRHAHMTMPKVLKGEQIVEPSSPAREEEVPEAPAESSSPPENPLANLLSPKPAFRRKKQSAMAACLADAAAARMAKAKRALAAAGPPPPLSPTPKRQKRDQSPVKSPPSNPEPRVTRSAAKSKV
uniref:B-related factor 1 n=1 Tax=Panagrellus redivivus TaxID=6233 RepID=A0A7E4V1A2_PANRE